jgi:ribonuclease T2
MASKQPRRVIARASAILTAALAISAPALAQVTPPPATLPFDYYVLTLSWSPGFCDLGGDEKSPQQCASPSSDGFVVHGLWPNNTRSENPEDCNPDADVSPADLAAAANGLYPTSGLALHEYVTHGTCTGLSAADYFATVRYARDQIHIPPAFQPASGQGRASPDEIEQAFTAVNPNLTLDNMAVTCARGELLDVRFCVSRDMKAFALCPKVSGHSCHRSSLVLHRG